MEVNNYGYARLPVDRKLIVEFDGQHTELFCPAGESVFDVVESHIQAKRVTVVPVGKLKDLFSGPERWTQGRMSNSDDLDKGTCFCLLGGLCICYPGPIFGSAVTKIQRIIGEQTNLATWNDTHTFEEVRALVEAANV